MVDPSRGLPSHQYRCTRQPNNVHRRLRRLYDSENKLIGTFCSKCKTERLIKKYAVCANDNEDTQDCSETQEMLSRPLPTLSEISAFKGRSSKTKVDILKPGDQIAWKRLCFYWHHAIVEEVYAETNELMLIHWNTKKVSIKIIRSRYKVDPKVTVRFNQMYRIDYSEEITKANDQELVLARARSRIGNKGYFPFIDDCETFATYCKTGVEKSHQLAWFKRQCNSSLHEVPEEEPWELI